jgi:hypothetical protein
MDDYRKVLDGKQTAWAAKRYHGHRTVSDFILAEYDEAHPTPTPLTLLVPSVVHNPPWVAGETGPQLPPSGGQRDGEHLFTGFPALPCSDHAARRCPGPARFSLSAPLPLCPGLVCVCTCYYTIMMHVLLVERIRPAGRGQHAVRGARQRDYSASRLPGP